MLRRAIPLTLLALTACQAMPSTITAPGPQDRREALGSQAASFRTLATDGEAAATGRLVATLKPGAAIPGGFHVVRQIGQTNQYLIAANTLASPVEVQRQVMRLQGMPDVLAARPEHTYQVFSTPNDPDFQQQWGLQKVNAPASWDKETGDGNPITVGIIDTGIDAQHPDLASRVVPGVDFIKAEDNGRDGNGHGTHVAGVIGAVANNATGVAGMNWGARLMPIRVMAADGSGTDGDIASGIHWAVDHGAKVLNMSIGGYSDDDTIRQAITYAVSKNVLVVAAMGNDDSSEKAFPAALPGVLAVGATDRNDGKAKFSNHGEWMGVCAPGVQIFSTMPTYGTTIPHKGPYGNLSGTSMATPLVSGLASLVWSKHPDWSAQQVKERIEQTADDLGDKGHDATFGYGRVNALKAIAG